LKAKLPTHTSNRKLERKEMGYRLVSVLVFNTVLASTVFATGHGEGGASHHGGIDWSLAFFPAINFAIFLVIVAAAYQKYFKKSLAESQARITRELDEAAIALQEATSKVSELKLQKENFSQEKVLILNRAKTEGEKTKTFLIEQAKKEAERISSDTLKQIKSSELALTKEMLRELVKLSMAQVSSELSTKLTEDTDKKLRNTALNAM